MFRYSRGFEIIGNFRLFKAVVGYGSRREGVSANQLETFVKGLCTDSPSCHLHKATIVLEKGAFLGSLKLGIGRVGSLNSLHKCCCPAGKGGGRLQPQQGGNEKERIIL